MGYEKYLQTVTDMAKGSMAWLRYAIPIGNDYKYAYCPGLHLRYYKNWSVLRSGFTCGNCDSPNSRRVVWFVRIHSGSGCRLAYVPQRRKVFSEYPDNWKTVPRVFPHWYRSVMQELVDNSRGTWFNRWGFWFYNKVATCTQCLQSMPRACQ